MSLTLVATWDDFALQIVVTCKAVICNLVLIVTDKFLYVFIRSCSHNKPSESLLKYLLEF